MTDGYEDLFIDICNELYEKDGIIEMLDDQVKSYEDEIRKLQTEVSWLRRQLSPPLEAAPASQAKQQYYPKPGPWEQLMVQFPMQQQPSVRPSYEQLQTWLMSWPPAQQSETPTGPYPEQQS